MARRPPREPPKSDEAVPDDLRTVFGQNLRAARIAAGLTQAQVGKRAGLPQQHVSSIEAGHENITIGTMTSLARVVGRDVASLLQKGRRRTGSR